MTDVSITCEQQLLRAHRTVLSIFSPFFRRVFDSITNPIHYPVIVLKDMPYADLRAIIDLMYRGEVTVTQDQFPSLKQSARVLEVSELSDIISSYEERNDLKFKLEDSISSSGRTTRKRGRPKRYTEESDEEYKASFETSSSAPPTKRQQAMLSNRSGASLSANKPTLTALLREKPPTATRGGLFPRQTAIRGGHSAFSKPQTATRGGVTLSKSQVATRTGMRGAGTSRGRGARAAVIDDDQDFDPSQEITPVRRTGKRGRPRKASNTREDKGLPMATSLPVSLPEPVEGVDLSNIFQNMSDVSSSTTAPPGAPMPQPFAPTIKLEPDSDSEVECIMSGTSPLPSGVMDDGPEITEIQETSVNEVSNSNAQITDSNVSQTASAATDEPTTNIRDSEPENPRNETQLNEESDIDSNVLVTNVVIKSEKPDSPVADVSQTPEENEQPIAPEMRPEESRESSEETRLVTTSQVEQTTTDTVSQSTASVPLVSTESTNPESSQAVTVPVLRRIKSERITPPPEDQTSFQPIDNQRQESEAISQSSIPTLTRVKSERISPNTAANHSTIEITINDDSNQESSEAPNVTSSRKDSADVGDALNAPNIDQTQDQTSQNNSDRNGDVSTSSQQSTADSNQQLPLPTIAETSDAQELDVQEFAFDCFYSNDEQPMQSYGSGANNASAVTFTASNISSFGFSSQDANHANNQQFIPNSTNFSQIITQTSNQNTFTSPPTTILTTSEQQQQQQPMIADSNQQFFAVNTSQAQLSQAPHTFSLDNNVVMNSPIHSDEECMLLDSPQQSGAYEVTIGGDNALDDSMDNL